MPLITTILNDQAPLLQYDDNWSAGSSQSDNNASFYYLGTFSTCTAASGIVKFSFNGTGFGIYGAKRPFHDSYTITVDEKQAATLSGDEPQNEEQYRQLLYNTGSLTQELHEVSLTNVGGGYVDIDFVTIQSQLGSSNQIIQTHAIQDTDSRFSYSGKDWNESPANVSMFNNGTGHSSTLDGDAVSLFGSVGPNNGFYQAQLDSEPTADYNATRQILLTQVMLYHADNLGSGNHQLTLTNTPQTASQSLNIDYAEIMTYQSSSTIPSSELNASTSHSSISNGGIAGLVVLGVTTLLLALSNFYLFRRLRITESQQVDMYRSYAGRPMTEYQTAASQAFTSAITTDISYDPSSRLARSSQNGASRANPFAQEPLNNDTGPSAEEGLFADPLRDSVTPTVSTSLPDYAQAMSRGVRQ
ncbi:hypothetical protein CONPUDRAFT_162772 [Coniophora puteana RWD-64-598 SS2]|uniref:Uncharacterized protein n=1 Tax=Coniophora puteana (strain RWD-64-598) TaxID=741705 RepID=A0A5M3N420_CONPW|nr:uncharacterized protein CONPUDRAFT_162772 [Coniophora puteana RWD-64-598 SS2]EIW85605.1 hypothetical protein CONPUDRAFT_162772 [Coniophora puteana RWD-64-598 SS2]